MQGVVSLRDTAEHGNHRRHRAGLFRESEREELENREQKEERAMFTGIFSERLKNCIRSRLLVGGFLAVGLPDICLAGVGRKRHQRTDTV